MRVEYETISDSIRRHLHSAHQQGKEIKRIVLSPDEYTAWRVEERDLKLPDDYKQFNMSANTFCGVRVVVEGLNEIRHRLMGECW